MGETARVCIAVGCQERDPSHGSCVICGA
jgi:hypothetical protein